MDEEGTNVELSPVSLATESTNKTASRTFVLRIGVGFLAFCSVLLLLLGQSDQGAAFLENYSLISSKRVSSGVSDPRSPFQQASKDYTALPLEERKKFSSQATTKNYNHDMYKSRKETPSRLATIPKVSHDMYKSRKETPSGWWPDENWLHVCANPRQAATFRPFSARKDWEGYRLGDCLKLCSGCPKKGSFEKLAHWSIAGEYYDLACDPKGPKYHQKKYANKRKVW